MIKMSVIVSEEDFLRTYETGVENFKDYLSAMSMYDTGKQISTIAKELGRNKNTVKGWCKESKTPIIYKALEFCWEKA